MLSAIATAASGLAAQSQRVEAAARQIASVGATAPTEGTRASSNAPVRIGALPTGDAIESVVTLIEAEQAYRMNAAGMLDTLFDAVDRRD